MYVKSCRRQLNCVALDLREALPYIFLFLYDAGVLHSYSVGNKPCSAIAVNDTEDVEVHFNC